MFGRGVWGQDLSRILAKVPRRNPAEVRGQQNQMNFLNGNRQWSSSSVRRRLPFDSVALAVKIALTFIVSATEIKISIARTMMTIGGYC